MTKKFLMGGVALLAMGGVAAAADLNVYPKAPAAALIQGFNWSGIYVGIHGGWEWSAFDPGFGANFDIGNPGVLGANASGGFFGGHLGLNYQAGPWVLGPRFDIDLSGLQGTTTDITTGSMVSHSIPWHGDFVGRLGYLVGPQILAYAVGGLAFGEVKDGVTSLLGEKITGTPNLSTSNVHVGWLAGAGLEYAINSNFSVGAEWNYIDLGKHGVTFVGPSEEPATFNIDNKAAWNSVKAFGSIKF